MTRGGRISPPGATSIRPKIVLLLTPSSRLLGARRSLLALAESLDRERWEPVVCGQSVGQLGEALAQRSIPMEVVRLGWWRKGKYMLWRPFAIARLTALARQVKADLIHCNELYPNPYAVRTARNVLAATDSPCAGRPIPVLTHVRLGMKPGMIRKYDLTLADHITVPSEALAAEFDPWEDRASRVTVIPNAVNMQEYHRTRGEDEARTHIGVPTGGVLLAAIGQLGPRKGGDIVLEAFEQVATRHPEVRLMFVGDPHRGQEKFARQLHQLAESSPYADRIFFFQFTKKILPYYEAADVNLLISRKEGFGRTIIESAAVGVPSIGASVGGIAEIIVDGATGRLIPPEDPAALAEAVEQLVTDAPLRRKMADSGFRHVAQNYSSAAHAQRMMDLYDSLLESKASPI